MKRLLNSEERKSCRAFHLMKKSNALRHLELVHRVHNDAVFALPTGVVEVWDMRYGELFTLHNRIRAGYYETVERGPD